MLHVAEAPSTRGRQAEIELLHVLVLREVGGLIQAGAGLVADSVPKKEYVESKNKAQALFAAIDRAEDGTL